LALTSPTIGGSSVDIVRSPTKATKYFTSFVLLTIQYSVNSETNLRVA
jgi:hypothetical protein